MMCLVTAQMFHSNPKTDPILLLISVQALKFISD